MKTGKRYSEDFKKDVVKMVKEEKRSVSSVSKDLGITEQTIRNWLVAETEKQDPEKSKLKELEKALKEREKRISELEMSVEILKKATAIFATNNRK